MEPLNVARDRPILWGLGWTVGVVPTSPNTHLKLVDGAGELLDGSPNSIGTEFYIHGVPEAAASILADCPVSPDGSHELLDWQLPPVPDNPGARTCSGYNLRLASPDHGSIEIYGKQGPITVIEFIADIAISRS